jgi:hypothetical protein
MAWFLSVVIDVVNVLSAIIKTKDHSPVGPDSHGPKASHLAFERMQPQFWLIHMVNGWGGVKRRQNIPQFLSVLRINAPWVVLLKKPF